MTQKASGCTIYTSLGVESKAVFTEKLKSVDLRIQTDETENE
jgi:hypothetical protein